MKKLGKMKLMSKFRTAAVNVARLVSNMPLFFILHVFMQFKERLSSCRTSKLVTYKKGDGSDVSSTSGESSSDEENFIDLRTLQAQGDLPQEFWQVRVDSIEEKLKPFLFETAKFSSPHHVILNARMSTEQPRF